MTTEHEEAFAEWLADLLIKEARQAITKRRKQEEKDHAKRTGKPLNAAIDR